MTDSFEKDAVDEASFEINERGPLPDEARAEERRTCIDVGNCESGHISVEDKRCAERIRALEQLR